jgi:hypothetical protein
MNLNPSMSSRKSRGELAAIFARLPAKNQPALLPALRAVVSTLHLAAGHGKLFATHTPADPIGPAPLAAPDDSRDLVNYLRNYVRVTLPPPHRRRPEVTSLLAMPCAHV